MFTRDALHDLINRLTDAPEIAKFINDAVDEHIKGLTAAKPIVRRSSPLIWIPVFGLYFADPKKVNRKVYEPYQLAMVIAALFYIWFIY